MSTIKERMVNSGANDQREWRLKNDIVGAFSGFRRPFCGFFLQGTAAVPQCGLLDVCRFLFSRCYFLFRPGFYSQSADFTVSVCAASVEHCADFLCLSCGRNYGNSKRRIFSSARFVCCVWGWSMGAFPCGPVPFFQSHFKFDARNTGSCCHAGPLHPVYFCGFVFLFAVLPDSAEKTSVRFHHRPRCRAAGRPAGFPAAGGKAGEGNSGL